MFIKLREEEMGVMEKKDFENEICISISNEQQEERIDKVIADVLRNVSRSSIQKLIKDGKVFINEKPVKSSYRVSEGEEIRFQVPKSTEPQIKPEQLPLDILYEDQDLLFINKPKNMVVHPAPGHDTGTLVNGILYYCKDTLSGINGIFRPGIVHRIDKDTTGVLVVCKNDAAHLEIAKQLKNHSITRKYFAIVHGQVKEDRGTIEGPIGRDEHVRTKMAINAQNGKEAVTHYKVLKRFSEFTYVCIQLETGRTHQIRVHMTSIGHPLLGDTVYGNRASKFRLEGQTLHAGILGVKHPASGDYLEISAPLPEYFEHLLNILS